MSDKAGFAKSRITRRSALKGLGAAAAIGTAPGYVRYAGAQNNLGRLSAEGRGV